MSTDALLPKRKARPKTAPVPSANLIQTDQDLGSSVKVQIRLPIDLARRLDVECAMTRRSRSQICEEILNRGLRKWRVQDLGPGSSPTPIVIETNDF